MYQTYVCQTLEVQIMDPCLQRYTISWVHKLHTRILSLAVFFQIMNQSEDQDNWSRF